MAAQGQASLKKQKENHSMGAAFKEYADYDALGLADLIASKAISVQEVLDAALHRIEQLNPLVNAVSVSMSDIARAQLEKGLPEGIFRGVPILLKDLEVSNYPGVPTQVGSRMLAHNQPQSISHTVHALMAAGFTLAGKTRVPNFGISATTEPVFGGPVRNPWHTGYSAGGSSGGAAAAVAAGMVPIAQATDAAGSLRLPASHCHLFGLKVSRGRVSAAPAGEFAGGLGSAHVLSHTVRDSAAALDIACQPCPGDPYFAPPPSIPYLQAMQQAPARLRIAISLNCPPGANIDPDVVTTIQTAGKLCESLGHAVMENTPCFDFAQATHDLVLIHGANLSSRVETLLEALGRAPGPEDIEEAALDWAAMGRKYTAADYADASRRLQTVGRSFGRFHQDYDILLTPVAAQPALPLGTLSMRKSFEEGYLSDLFAHMAFTSVTNATGQPGMSVPMGFSSNGLPIGAQFTAAYGREDLLLALAAQIEQARPWRQQHSQVWHLEQGI
tara:strand:- start:113992 stop:115494 length:1503 start_codon:yes stop_codon:yes gene_type:complete